MESGGGSAGEDVGMAASFTGRVYRVDPNRCRDRRFGWHSPTL